MNTLFAPAIGLMNRLRYPQKFALLGVVALLAIVILQSLIYRELNRVIKPSRQELTGVAILAPVNRMTQAMQQHRGMSSGILNGNEALKPQRAEKEQKVDQELAAAEALMSPEMIKTTVWQSMRSDWLKLKADGLAMPAPDNLKLHTRMIATALTAMADIADMTALTLDPDLDGFYMMDAVVLRLPAALEPLGIMRARGTGILAKKAITDDQRLAISVLMDRIESMQVAQKNSLEKVMASTPKTRAVLAESSKRFESDVTALLALVRSDILGGSFQTESTAYFKQTTSVIDQGYQLMFDALLPTLDRVIRDRLDRDETALKLTFVVTIGVTLLFAWLAIGAYLAMSAGVRALGEGAERLAAGDLTGRVVCPSRDELDDVAGHFNHMAESMHALLRTVQQTVSRLGQTATVVSTSAMTVANSSEKQSESASAMAAAVEELTVGIHEISDHTTGAQRISDEAQQLSTEGGLIVEQTVAEMKLIAQSVNHSSDVIAELGRQSDAISAIVGTIKDIADQTNLLALNAAIEAARAGEQGRGFAVVADEVRKLAERTTQSTQEISTMIGAIQQGTAGAVRSMQEGVARVNDGVALSQRAGASISKIREGALKVQQDVAEISNGLKEEAIASTDIAKNVERIASMVEANSQAVNETANATAELERLASELQAEVARFTV